MVINKGHSPSSILTIGDAGGVGSIAWNLQLLEYSSST